MVARLDSVTLAAAARNRSAQPTTCHALRVIDLINDAENAAPRSASPH
jgi:hypothetical protein